MALYLPSILAEVAGPNLAKARSTSSLTCKANNEWQLIRKTTKWVYDKVHYRYCMFFNSQLFGELAPEMSKASANCPS
jgi:hypothetical protein